MRLPEMFAHAARVLASDPSQDLVIDDLPELPGLAQVSSGALRAVVDPMKCSRADYAEGVEHGLTRPVQIACMRARTQVGGDVMRAMWSVLERLTKEHVHAMRPVLAACDRRVIYLVSDDERVPAVALANAGVLRVLARHGSALEFGITPFTEVLVDMYTRAEARR